MQGEPLSSHHKTTSIFTAPSRRVVHHSHACRSMDLTEVPRPSEASGVPTPKKLFNELRKSTLAVPALRGDDDEDSNRPKPGHEAVNSSMEVTGHRHVSVNRPRTEKSKPSNEPFSVVQKSPRSQLVISHKGDKSPLTPAEALRLYESQLSDYEKGEILYIQQVYFVGNENCTKVRTASSRPNFGFDDEKGNYQFRVGDHINYRYEILSLLGKGVFGQVVKCLDHKRNELVAVKVITNKARFQQQGAVEIKVLDLIRNKDTADRQGVVKLKTSFMFRRHICMVFELMSISLAEFIKTSGKKGVSQGLVRRFALQLVLALHFLQGLKVIHCDLKPENILLKDPRRSGIRVIDFGSSCLESAKVYTYIQSRFYRAPEVILGLPYSCSIDMWSLGCVLAELFLGVPLLQGESEHDQLLAIMEVIGLPPKELIQASPRRRLFFEGNVPKPLTTSKGKQHLPDARPLATALKGASPLFLDFIRKCLKWDPAQRLSPETALAHRWIQEGIASLHQESRTESSIASIDRD